MNFNKETKSEKFSGPNINCPVIKISHFKDDKLEKVETFSVTHFLDSDTTELKQIKYN